LTDDYIGKLSSIRWGMVFANIALNLLHLGLWFVCLWLVLKFQMGHALGFAAVIWLVLTLTLLPMLFRKAEDAAKQHGTLERTGWLWPERTRSMPECA
jgi:hypothetical protein